MHGRVQSIGAGPGRRGLVGAAQLDTWIPRVRVCVGIAQVAVQKKTPCREIMHRSLTFKHISYISIPCNT